jgi:hypothetical protein
LALQLQTRTHEFCQAERTIEKQSPPKWTHLLGPPVEQNVFTRRQVLVIAAFHELGDFTEEMTG